MTVTSFRKFLPVIQREIDNLTEAHNILKNYNRSERPAYRKPRRVTLSAEARRRIAIAQRKRWAKWKRDQR